MVIFSRGLNYGEVVLEKILYYMSNIRELIQCWPMTRVEFFQYRLLVIIFYHVKLDIEVKVEKSWVTLQTDIKIYIYIYSF